MSYFIIQQVDRVIDIVSMVEMLIYKQYYNSNTQKFYVLIKLKPCIILKLFLILKGVPSSDNEGSKLKEEQSNKYYMNSQNVYEQIVL